MAAGVSTNRAAKQEHEEDAMLHEKKIKEEIAIISEKILAQPERNLKDLKRLFVLAFDLTPTRQEQVEVVSKIATLSITSLVIIFRDILPGYPIVTAVERKEGGVTLSTETLRIRKFESQLLEYYVKLVNELLHRRKRKNSNGLGKPWLNSWKTALKQVVLPEHTRALCFLLADLAHFNEANRIAKALIKYTPRANEQEQKWIEETLTGLLSSLHRFSGNTMKSCLDICQYICNFASKSGKSTPSIFCTALCCINYASLYSEYQQALYHQEQPTTENDATVEPLVDERSFQRDWMEAQGRARNDELRARFEKVIQSVEQFLFYILAFAENGSGDDIPCLRELLELFVKVSIYLSQVSIHRLELCLQKLAFNQTDDIEKSCLLLRALYQVHFLREKNRGSNEDTGYLDSILYQICGRLVDCRSTHDTKASKLFGSLLKSSLWLMNPARNGLWRRKTMWKRLLWLVLRTESPLLMNIITAVFIHGIPEDWSLFTPETVEDCNVPLEMLIRQSMDKNPDIPCSSDSPPFYEYFILCLHFHPFVQCHFSSLIGGTILPVNESLERWLSLYTDDMTFIPPVAQTRESRKPCKRKSSFIRKLIDTEQEQLDWQLCPIKKTRRTISN